MNEILTVYNVVTHRTKSKYYKDILNDSNRIKNIGLNKYISFCFWQHEFIDSVVIDTNNLIDEPEDEYGIYVIIHNNNYYWETSKNWQRILKYNVVNNIRKYEYL